MQTGMYGGLCADCCLCDFTPDKWNENEWMLKKRTTLFVKNEVYSLILGGTSFFLLEVHLEN